MLAAFKRLTKVNRSSYGRRLRYEQEARLLFLLYFNRELAQVGDIIVLLVP